ncbi:MAG: SpoIIE family protein phosphatase [Flavobacteriales bacterium]|nr:SpoIIE family protein phosphatase [Flavobacteriales bacterium]
MNFRFTIPWKIGVGFGMFVVVTGVLFFLTSNTLSESRSINREINEVYAPGIEAVEELSTQLSYSELLIRYWGTVQSRDDVVEKRNMRTLISTEIPSQLSTLDSLSAEWNNKEQFVLDSLNTTMERLFILYQQVMVKLPDFDSYADQMTRMDIEFLLLPDEGIDKELRSAKGQIDRLLKAQRSNLLSATQRSDALGDRLRFLAGNISIFILIVGVVIAFLVSRSIVRPVNELKRTLLYLGKGIYPRSTVEVTSDEIGQMAFAVNRLVDGLKKTREFSAQVGSGNFEATYTPLSEDDELGFALLKMRDDLAASERHLERKVEERTNEVVQQKEEIERQKERVTELYKDLTDSINYAKRLQQAILPTKEFVLDMFPDSFVMYRPRDIVSGDFYWFKTTGKKNIFAAVDCTGHGVPGAFMSLVGHNVLNQVTKVFTRPSQILNNLNRLAAEALRSEESETGVSDGMDLAMVTIDMESLELEYAGAYNPLYIIRNKEIIQLKADNFSIGSFRFGEREYNNHKFQLEKGDAIYAFSDGYVDQFGGDRGKKFLKKRFRETLLSVSDLPMDVQHQKLNETFVRWKKSLDQVDDILVIGIRV